MLLALMLIAAGTQRYEAKVDTFDARSGKIHVTMKDQSTGDWTLAPKANVFDAERKRAGRGVIHAGEEISLAVNEQGIVEAVWLQPAFWGRPVDGGKVKRWDGKIVSFERRDPAFIFQIQQLAGPGTVHFTANAQTHWFKMSGGRRQPASVDDARKDQEVTVLVSQPAHQVTEVLVR